MGFPHIKIIFSRGITLRIVVSWGPYWAHPLYGNYDSGLGCTLRGA